MTGELIFQAALCWFGHTVLPELELITIAQVIKMPSLWEKAWPNLRR
jgi:hypothetical protein